MPAVTGRESIFNAAIGLNVLAWAVLGLVYSDPADRYSGVRIAVAILNTLVGVLFLTRRPLRKSGSWFDFALTIPSFIVWGLAFRLAPLPRDWPLYSQVLFCMAAVFTGISLLYLGRSFAILPADRGTVEFGPYRLIRHPIYLGELLLMVAMLTAAQSALVLLLTIAAVPTIVLRLLVEERLLTQGAAYGEYAAQVRWRLLPGIW